MNWHLANQRNYTTGVSLTPLVGLLAFRGYGHTVALSHMNVTARCSVRAAERSRAPVHKAHGGRAD